MEVRLVVANGKNVGQLIPIPGPTFRIGRADDCDLRPRSDVISRVHCTIVVADEFVNVRDSSSKNGTFVNGQQIMGEQELKNGDRLRVGQLEFDVLVTGEGDDGGDAHRSPAADGPGVAGESPLAGLDLSDWVDREDSSGTVLGMLPLRRASSVEPEKDPDTAEKPKSDDGGTKSDGK